MDDELVLVFKMCIFVIFQFKNWRWFRVSVRDKCFYLVFLINFLIMVGCVVVIIMCFFSDKGQINKFFKNKVEFTIEEIIILACGVIFFVAFFIVMTVEIKVRYILYKLFFKFVIQNIDWVVEFYDRNKDSGYFGLAVLV